MTGASTQSGDIAIVGMACVFPGAEGPEAFWRNICGGSDRIRQPEEGWGAERYLSGVGPVKITTAAGGYLGDLYRFDPAELGVMPSSVDGSEPDQFLALKAARDALRDAGYLDGHDHATTGIVLGHSTYLHRGNANVVQHGVAVDQTVALIGSLLPGTPAETLSQLRSALVANLPPFNADTAPGLVPNVMTGRIANRLDLAGPNYLIDAACASSLISVQMAIEELRTGRSDMMIAGGVNASIPAEVYMVFTQLGALSRRGKVRPFDVDTDGTLLGEGLGMVVLKRLEDAVRDGDRIYATVKAVRQASDGRGSGLLAPRLEGEVLAIRRALGETDIAVGSIGLIEAHGTGIPLGDRTEIEALRQVYGSRTGDFPRTALGAVKSMIGHCIPAAGVAGLIKTALALHYRTLPPTLCETVQPALSLETTPFYVNTETRPWIAPRGEKRRAAINAFGFGGINSHAILEEAPKSDRAPRPEHLPAELVVLSAADPGALRGLADRLAAQLAGPLSAAPLSGVAAAATARFGSAGPARLALVAESVADLADKLAKAGDRLGAGRPTFQVRSGIYAGNASREGKIAFVFPGEGAQYQGMLSETLVAFPEARRWFDFWDGLYGDSRGFRPSDCVFPAPNSLSPQAAKRLQRELFGLEMGSESAFVASQALLAVADRLGLKADALVGHSSGEHAALRAAGVFGGEDFDELETRIRELNRLYRQMDGAGAITTGALLTIGNVPRERALALADGHTVHLALDNCLQQTVLYGPRPRLEAIAGELGREGGLCAFLPFDRPYHTPLFRPIADMVEGIYAGMEFQSPRTVLYSCATAAPMPSDPAELRSLAAAQWRSRVRFTETIERMYADGFRTFVEVGASANLTGFIENVLQGKDALAVSLDSRRRSSLAQLLHAVGRLWSAGVPLQVDALIADREIAAIDLDAAKAPVSRARLFPNTLPYLKLQDDQIVTLRAAFAATPALRSPEAAPAGDLDEQAYPFLHRIVSAGSGTVVAECDLDAGRDEFLRQHVLYTSEISDIDPTLTGLPTCPLAVSMEMLVEIAAYAVGGLSARRLENVVASNWIAFDDERRTVTLEARVVEGQDGPRVSARLADAAGHTLVQADVLFGGVEIQPPLQPLYNPQAPVWRDEDLYSTGMFHGPLFHSIEGLLAWDESGLDATLADTPLTGFFTAGVRPRLQLNPVLLDAIGHVTAFWIAQNLGTDFSSFPSRIRSIDLFDAAREDTGGGTISGRLGFETGESGGRFLTGDFAGFAADGALLFQASGWRDRFFDVPNRFYFARFRPREGFYGDDVSGLFHTLPEGAVVWSVPAFPPGFLDDAGGIWRRVLVNTVLAAEERAEWRVLPGHQRRRDDWLTGRIALKEAVRTWMADMYRVDLLPADIAFQADEQGKPHLVPDAFAEFDTLPAVSVAHVEGEAVAVAAPPNVAVGIDLERAGRVSTPDLLSGGFSDVERKHLFGAGEDDNGRVLQAWCAKEAAAKCIGSGLGGSPTSFFVSALDDQGGAQVEAGDWSVSVSLAEDGPSVFAVAYM